MEEKGNSDCKLAYSGLWNKAFEKTWNSLETLKVVVPPVAEGEGVDGLKSQQFIHHLMVQAVFTFICDRFERYESKLEETEAKLARFQQVFESLTESATMQDVTHRIQRKDTTLEPERDDLDATQKLKPTESGCYVSDSEKSPSLLRQRVENRVNADKPQTKENQPSSALAFLRKADSGAKSSSVSPPSQSAKNPAMIASLVKPLKSATISNQASPSGSKSLSQSKRMIQTRLDVSRVTPKPARIDLTASEEYLGGVRPSAIKRKSDKDDSDAADFLRPAPPHADKKIKGTLLHAQAAEEDSGEDLDETCFPLELPETATLPGKTEDTADSPALFPESPAEQPPIPPAARLNGLSRPKTARTKPIDNTTTLAMQPPNPRGSHVEVKRHQIGNDTMEIISDFNKIPTKEKQVPSFKYKPDKAVRGAERQKLPALPCDLCQKYYEALESQFDDVARESIINKCSRHRQQYKPREYDTPPDYWRTDMPSTPECISKGLIRVECEADTQARHKI